MAGRADPTLTLRLTAQERAELDGARAAGEGLGPFVLRAALAWVREVAGRAGEVAEIVGAPAALVDLGGDARRVVGPSAVAGKVAGRRDSRGAAVPAPAVPPPSAVAGIAPRGAALDLRVADRLIRSGVVGEVRALGAARRLIEDGRVMVDGVTRKDAEFVGGRVVSVR